MKLLDLDIQNKRIEKDLAKRLSIVFDHGKYIQGPEVFELEEKLCEFSGAKHCITCGNGTDALQIAQMASGISHRSNVLTTGFSYIATAETIALLGAKPVFTDIRPETFNMNEDLLSDLNLEDIDAIIPVSLFGQMADLEFINKISKDNNIITIEDAAQSFGAQRSNKKSCSISDISCTSFFPSKPLGCYGDGGAIFTNDEELSIKIRQIANHGQKEKYNHVRIGVNSRLDTVQAAILLAKLEIFSDELEARNNVANLYFKHLSQIAEIKLPKIDKNNISAWAQFSIRIDKRDDVKDFLLNHEIPSAVYYPIPLNQQKALQNLNCNLPVGDRVSSQVLSLPMHPYLKESEVVKVCNVLSDCVEKNET